MYKHREFSDCHINTKGQIIKVLLLNGSLKKEDDLSNTEELALEVIERMKKYDVKIESENIRLANKNIPVGLGYKESDDDEWPEIAEKIKSSDIILFATPIWWGSRSSLMQRVLERMDSLDEEYLKTGRSVLYNKVAGIVITGHEDGALSTMGHLMAALSWFNFVLPPECAAYWVGEVGETGRENDRQKRLKNNATKNMIKSLARNLVFYSVLLKEHPLEWKK